MLHKHRLVSSTLFGDRFVVRGCAGTRSEAQIVAMVVVLRCACYFGVVGDGYKHRVGLALLKDPNQFAMWLEEMYSALPHHGATTGRDRTISAPKLFNMMKWKSEDLHPS